MEDDIHRYRSEILDSFEHGLKVSFQNNEHAPRKDAEMTRDEQLLLWKIVNDALPGEYTDQQRKDICRVFRAFQDHLVSKTLDLKEAYDENTARGT